MIQDPSKFIGHAPQYPSASTPIHDQLDVMALALHRNKVGCERIVAMLDGMVVTLSREQIEGDSRESDLALKCAAERWNRST